MLPTRLVLSTSSAVLVAQLSLAAGGIVSARALGASGKGVFAGIVIWQQTLVWAGGFGVDTALTVRLSGTAPGDESRQLRTALGHAVGYAMSVGAVLALVAAMVMPRVLNGLGGHALLVALAMVTIPFGMLAELVLAINVGIGRVGRYNACRITNAVVSLCLLCAFWAGRLLSPSSAVLAVVTGSLSGLALGALGLPWRRMAVDRRQLWQDMRFGCQVHAATLLGMTNVRLDLLVMATLLPATAVGLYSTANNVMLPVMLIAEAGAFLLAPTVARAMAAADESDPAAFDRFIRLVRHEAARYGTLSALGGVALFLTAPVIIPALLGRSFAPAVRLTWILIPGFVARAYGNLLLAGTVGARRPLLSNLAQVAGVTTTLALLPLLLPRYGATGAAVTSTLSYGLFAVVAAVGIRQVRPRRPVTATGSVTSFEPLGTEAAP